MMRSMFSGVSSLRVHQTRMDVIANNIANVNTVGFKSARATFSDAFYQRLSGAAGPDPLTGRAGTNPMQVGLGLNLASIDNIMSQGATQRTDNALDVMIAGDGFFIVQDAGGTAFTRAGNIQMDFHRNLHINGMQLMGWSTRLDETTGVHVVDRSVLQPLQLSGDKQHMPSESTGLLNIVGNLNTNQLDDNDQIINRMTLFDSLGNRHVVDVRFTFHRTVSEAPTVAHSYWTMEFVTGDHGVVAFLEGDREDPNARGYVHICVLGQGVNGVHGMIDDDGDVDTDAAVTSLRLAFDSNGQLIFAGIPEETDPPYSAQDISTFAPGENEILWEGSMIGTRQMPLTALNGIAIVPAANIAPTATFGRDPEGRQLPRSTYENGTTPTTMTSVGFLNFGLGELFQRGGANTDMRTLTMNGNGPGVLRDISIGGDGTIVGRFSNGRTRVLGQIPLAQFPNPAGLERMGANLWAETANSGLFDGVGSIGAMQGGALEMSNVDLANEFTDMITTQRGFQAASRTITVSDEMLQELVNLRR